MSHLAHIDGLRAIAVIAVIAYHAVPGLLPGGFLGVDVFFVISGFVVTASLADHAGESLTIFVARFYQRRLTRILPALLVVLLVTSAAWVLLIPRSWLSGQSERVALFAFAGLSNWALINQSDSYFAPRAEFNPYTHTWSLGVEEQFYLVAPGLIFVALSLRREWRRLAIPVLIALTLVSMMLTVRWTFPEPVQAFFGVASRFWELSVGALWFLVVWRDESPVFLSFLSPPHAAGLAAAAAGLLALSLYAARPATAPLPWAFAAVFSTLLLIGTPPVPRTHVARALCSPSLCWVGLRSYSLYLWHWPVFVLARWTLGMDSAGVAMAAIVVSLLCALVSYRFVESPLRASAWWRTHPAWLANTSLVFVAGMAALVAGLMFQFRAELSLSSVERNRTDWYPLHQDPTLVSRGDCGNASPRYTPFSRQTLIEHLPCAIAVPAGQPPARLLHRLFVLGDSHATAYLPLLQRLSRDEGVHVLVYQIPGCPFIDLKAPMGQGRPPECLSEPRIAVRDVLSKAQPGDTVFLASLRLPRFADPWGVESTDAVMGQHFSTAQVQARHAAIVDADEWLLPLLHRGLRVVLAAPTPIFRAPSFRCVDPWTRHNSICAQGLSESRSDEMSFRAPVMQALQSLAVRHAAYGVTVFDPFDAICPGDRCSAIDPDGRPLFFDADHVSRWGNEVIYPLFHRLWLCTTHPSPSCSLPAFAQDQLSGRALVSQPTQAAIR